MLTEALEGLEEDVLLGDEWEDEEGESEELEVLTTEGMQQFRISDHESSNEDGEPDEVDNAGQATDVRNKGFADTHSHGNRQRQGPRCLGAGATDVQNKGFADTHATGNRQRPTEEENVERERRRTC